MAASDSSITDLVAAVPSYDIYKTKIEIDREQIPALYEKLKTEFSDATVSTMDGLRLDWSDKWMLVRPSNTEPIVRAIAEAKSMVEAKLLCDRAAELA